MRRSGRRGIGAADRVKFSDDGSGSVWSAWSPLFLHALDPNAFTTRAGEEVHTEGEAYPQHTHSHEENRDPDHRLHEYLQVRRPRTVRFRPDSRVNVAVLNSNAS